VSRLQLGLTWWHRRTSDELRLVPLPTGLPGEWENVASVSQHGFEATASLPLWDTWIAQSDLQLTYAHQTSKVLSLGQNGSAGTGLIVGYPIDALIGYPIVGVADTVGGHADHIYEGGEAIFGSGPQYYGVYEPPTTVTLTPRVGLFGGRARLSAVFDRETGFMVNNNNRQWCAFALTCADAFDPTTPILLQAQLWNPYGNNPVAMESGNFTRWREANLTIDIPTRFLRVEALHLAFSHASVSLQGRNLALWTHFSGTDPESQPGAGQYGPDRSGIPQGRSWGFRFDLTP